MRKVFLQIFLLIFFCSNVSAKNLNFNKLTGDEGNEIMVNNRCSALFNYVYSRIILNENMRDVAETYLKLNIGFSKLAALTDHKQNKTLLEEAKKNQLEKMMLFEKKYREDAKYYKKKNGDHISGVIKEDLIFCMTVAKGISDQFPNFFK